jgi:hypothetical protein
LASFASDPTVKNFASIFLAFASEPTPNFLKMLLSSQTVLPHVEVGDDLQVPVLGEVVLIEQEDVLAGIVLQIIATQAAHPSIQN